MSKDGFQMRCSSFPAKGTIRASDYAFTNQKAVIKTLLCEAQKNVKEKKSSQLDFVLSLQNKREKKHLFRNFQLNFKTEKEQQL